MNECCKDKKNLERKEESSDRALDVCRVCGNRHIRMVAESGHIGATLSPLGGNKADGNL